MLTLDAADDPPPIDGLSSKFEPVMDIFGQLDAQLETTAPPEPGEGLSILMLGVADGFARRGIAQELIRTALHNGAARGYRWAVTTATNPVSQHIFRKPGFTTIAQASYTDCRWRGDAVFASIGDAGGPMAMRRFGFHGLPAKPMDTR